MNEPSGKAVEWTEPGAISFRLHVETWDGFGPHHQRPATPADLAAALVAAPQYVRMQVLSELPEWVEIDPVVLGLRDQIRRADRALVPALQAETDRLKRELAELTGAINFLNEKGVWQNTWPRAIVQTARDFGWQKETPR